MSDESSVNNAPVVFNESRPSLGGIATSTKLELFEKFLHEWKFFLPPAEVTTSIVRLNREYGYNFDARRSIRVQEREGLIVSNELHDEDLFQSVAERASAILFHDDAEKGGSMTQREAIDFYSKFVSERIYNHLAMLSRSPHTKEGGSFSIREELSSEIAGRLGLGLYLSLRTPEKLRKETADSLNYLGYEFQQWLVKDRNGVHATPWGVLCSIEKAKEVKAEGIYAYPLVLEADVEREAKFQATPAVARAQTW